MLVYLVSIFLYRGGCRCLGFRLLWGWWGLVFIRVRFRWLWLVGFWGVFCIFGGRCCPLLGSFYARWKVVEITHYYTI